MLVWRDSFDRHTYHFGTKDTCWFTLYEDGVDELFGSDLYHKLRDTDFINEALEVKLYTKEDLDVAIQGEREECALIADNWGGVGEQVAKEIRERK